MKLKRSAVHPLPQPSKNDSAWFYENAGSIDIYIVPIGGGAAVSCRIQRALLADWLSRTERTRGKQ